MFPLSQQMYEKYSLLTHQNSTDTKLSRIIDSRIDFFPNFLRNGITIDVWQFFKVNGTRD